MTSQNLLDWLAARYPTAKRATLRRMVSDGRVTVNGAVARNVKVEVGPSDCVEASDQPRARANRAKPQVAGRRRRLPFRIVHEDNDLLVVDKPAGMLTSTVPNERRPTLLAAVREYVASSSRDRAPARIGLIHRLDRDASGLLVFSKSDAAYRALKTQFFHHTVERVYLAVTEGIPNPRGGRIESRLKERADGSVYSTREHAKGERAVTHYEVIGESGKRALVRVRLETGRKHQIRVHLAQRGTPIVGDRMYGTETASGAGGTRLMLAAVRLGFEHPRTGRPVVFELDTPSEFVTRGPAGAD